MSNMSLMFIASLQFITIAFACILIAWVVLSLVIYFFYVFSSFPPTASSFKLFFYSSEWDYSEYIPYYKYRRIIGPIKIGAYLGFYGVQLMGLFTWLFFIKNEETRYATAAILIIIPAHYIWMSSHYFYMNLAKLEWEERVKGMDNNWAKLLELNDGIDKYKDKYLGMWFTKRMSFNKIKEELDKLPC